jgi:hypothetical protein
MVFKKYLLGVACGLLVLPVVGAWHKRKAIERSCGNDKQRCQERNNTCQCYCAYKPGPRDKTAEDTLIFVENDPEGHYCYCRQRDIDKIAADKKNQETDI